MATQPRPRPTPVRPSVRPFRGLLDRAAESEAALKTLPELAPVEFYGQSGIGKTALLRHLAYNTPDGHFPDGMVYRDQAGSQPAADLLQFLFDSFYESGRDYKPREAELLNLLRDKRALVLLDDVDMPRAEIERTMNAAPECAFLLSSAERRIFGEGRALRLQGLPDPESTQLLERELGRLLAPGEQVAAQAICALLEGHPLHIAQAAAAAQERNLPLGELAEKMQAAKAKGQNPADLLNQWTVGDGSDDEKRVMAAMAAGRRAGARRNLGGALRRKRPRSDVGEFDEAQDCRNARRRLSAGRPAASDRAKRLGFDRVARPRARLSDGVGGRAMARPSARRGVFRRAAVRLQLGLAEWTTGMRRSGWERRWMSR